MTTQTLGTPVQGVTLYSFTRLFHGRQKTFIELVREAAARGLGPGLEFVGFQSIKGFPEVPLEFERQFKDLMEETGLLPTSLSGNADAGLRRDRMMTNDELVDYMRPQIAVAKRLGFPVLRVQYSLTPDDMERLLPVAEEYDVALGMEIHAHHTPSHPHIMSLRERFEKLDSPLLGFIPDWGSSMARIPRTLLRRYAERGFAPEFIKELDEYWTSQHGTGGQSDEVQVQQFEHVVGLAKKYGADEVAVEIAVNCTGLFGHAEPEEWADILPRSVHTHGKFYEIDEHGEETATPVRAIIDTYVKNGYSKTISSEWEGFHWNIWDDPFDIVAKQQALMRNAAEASGSRMITDPNEARAVLGR